MVHPITATTQDHLPIHDIRDGLVILKNGSAAMVIQTNAVNFGLLSEPEQDAIIYAYAALVNSLNFPIQILIRSERKDISSYLSLLADAEKKQASPTKRAWISAYRTFVADTVQRKNVLDKKFYIIVPFSSLELGTASSLGSAVVSSLRTAPSAQHLPAPISDIVKKATMTLVPKRDHLLKQVERIGLTAHQLTNQELLSLLYRTYNPGTAAPPVNPEQLAAPIVQPVMKGTR